MIFYVRSNERYIVPWPSLNLPSVGASERLKEGLSPKDVEKAMIHLLKIPEEELAKADEDGDTLVENHLNDIKLVTIDDNSIVIFHE